MKLFEPARIGSLRVKNRMVMPPMNSRTGNTDGTVSQRTIDYYSRRAHGGVGLIVVEGDKAGGKPPRHRRGPPGAGRSAPPGPGWLGGASPPAHSC